MRNLLLFFSVIFISLFYSSCQREDSYIKKEEDQISKARTWFSNYLSQPVNPIFSKINFHWDRASIFTFKNGYKAVTVPITEGDQNPAYKGKRILYLYPWKNGKGYYVTVFELIPSLQHILANKGNISLKTFTGYISTWDLKKGFVRGAKFTDGVIETNIQIEIKSTLPAISSPTTHRNLSTVLPNVTVTAYIPGPSWGTYWITLTNNLGYSTSYLWDGGANVNPCEYSGCDYSENPADYFEEKDLKDIYNEFADQQWLDQIKDSTNNPCASNTIMELKGLSQSLPELFRNIFGSASDINITFKSANNGPESGGHTEPNYASNNFTITLNNYWEDQTSLSLAATILHEVVHAQLMNWYRQAIRQNDVPTQQYLATNYYLFFDSASVARYPELNFNYLMNQNQGGQHQIMVMGNIRDAIAGALLEFARKVDPNTTVDELYCWDMAWTGTSDSQGFKILPQSEKDRLIKVFEGERGNNNASPDYTQKGKPCP